MKSDDGLRGRLALAPMTTYSSLSNGTIDPSELPYLRRRAEGGLGIILTAACCVHPSGLSFDGQWACWSDSFLNSLSEVAEAIHEGGSKAILQIHHGGRMAPSRLCGTPLSASAIPAERPNAETPAEMSDDLIEEMIGAFGDASRRAYLSGFDGVEIHGANTYLLQQFVSPHSNRRTDKWGEDRNLFSIRVIQAVQAAVPADYIVGYRFSPEEQESPGLRLSETMKLIEETLPYNLSYLHVSLRDWRQPSVHAESGSSSILSQVLGYIEGRVPLMVAGGVKDRSDFIALAELGCGYVAVGRAAISDPDAGSKLLSGEKLKTKMPFDPESAGALILPDKLRAKIYSTPGWFEIEEPSAPHAE